ncbi:MAG: restriction endonuclease [Bacteroidetes bacterium]|nr:restriction endonuclease [Bacteroidota bacterium]
MRNKKIVITKASGEIVPFSSQKLINSLVRAGATKKAAAEIARQVAGKIFEGIRTKKIYEMAFSLLRGHGRHLAARYHLKGGIMELGPSGFPFEKYVGEILRHMGYDVKIGQTIQGHCVTHEVDIVAEKDEQHFLVECKFHNSQGITCDVKIPLYIHARFMDIELQWEQIPGHEKKFHQSWLVTNTRFSPDALQYGTCSGLHLISWDYPRAGSLKELVDSQGLYPITCLTSLTKNEKRILLDNRIVLSKELCDNPNALVKAGITVSRIKTILDESNLLCRKQEKINLR